MSKNPWTRDQAIVLLTCYCKIPFNLVRSTYPEVVKISQIVGRSPNAVKMNIRNFGSIDSELRKRNIVGLGNTSTLHKDIWNEFSQDWERLSFESEKLKATFLGNSIEEMIGIRAENLPNGEDWIAMRRRRVNQDFFSR